MVLTIQGRNSDMRVPPLGDWGVHDEKEWTAIRVRTPLSLTTTALPESP